MDHGFLRPLGAAAAEPRPGADREAKAPAAPRPPQRVRGSAKEPARTGPGPDPRSPQRSGTRPVRPAPRRNFRAGPLQNGEVPGMMAPREAVSRGPQIFWQAWGIALTTDPDCGRLHGNLYSTGLCFSDSASLPGVEGGSQGLTPGRRLHMRRTIAQSALVFASVLLIIALAGCNGSSKKVVQTPDPGTPDPGTPTTPTGTAITGLPPGYMLASRRIAAGADPVTILPYSKGRSATISCPSGGEACVITVAADRTATYTGGRPVVMVRTNEMVWQANNGNDPTMSSDGDHADGLRGTLVTGGASPQLNRVFSAVPIRTGGAAGGNVQSTKALSSTATDTLRPTASWTNGARMRPTLGLTLSPDAISPLGATALGANAGKLTLNSDSTVPDLGTGWEGFALSKKDIAGGRDVQAVMYSNIDSPTGYSASIPFAAGADLSSDSDVTTSLGTSTTTALAFDLPNVGDLTRVRVSVDSRDWTQAVGQNVQLTEAVTITYRDSKDAAQSRTGTMKCVTPPCQAQGGSLQGAWEIEANAVPGSVDGFYLTFGSWLSLPDDSSGTYIWGTFADGNTAAQLARANAINRITAAGATPIKYEGPATGLYARSTGVGSFTATTKLDVDFGTSATTFGGVSGSVTNFMENGESLGNWILSLKDTEDDAGVLFVGETALEVGGYSLTEGEWGVQLYWDGSQTGFAAGTFSASTPARHENPMHIIGSFGAEEQD